MILQSELESISELIQAFDNALFYGNLRPDDYDVKDSDNVIIGTIKYSDAASGYAFFAKEERES